MISSPNVTFQTSKALLDLVKRLAKVHADNTYRTALLSIHLVISSKSSNQIHKILFPMHKAMLAIPKQSLPSKCRQILSLQIFSSNLPIIDVGLMGLVKVKPRFTSWIHIAIILHTDNLLPPQWFGLVIQSENVTFSTSGNCSFQTPSILMVGLWITQIWNA